MNIAKLSPEERQAISQLVRSPGWLIVMREIILPQVQNATARLDAFGTHENHTNAMRGVKYAFSGLVEQLYKVAELPNPFERHAQALLTDLKSYAGESEDVLPTEDPVCVNPVCGHSLSQHRQRSPETRQTIACALCDCSMFSLLTIKEERPRRVSFPV